MSAEGGSKAIVAAMLANLVIAVMKFVGFLLSGASSMLAESIHSLADTGNQVLLLIGGKRAQREASREHPFGYGRVRYLYAFLVSIILFSLGGVFAIYEGVHKIQHPEPLERWWIPVVILVGAIVAEGLSLRTAVREANHVRGEQSLVTFVRRAKAPEIPVVLLEDSGAVCGLLFALAGVTLTAITGNGVFDGIGTITIGALLVAIAIVLAIETSSLLVGEGATRPDAAAIRGALEGNGATRIIHLKTLHLGPDELLVAAKIAIECQDDAASIAAEIAAAEKRIREAVPIARVIYLEPDLYVPEEARGDSASSPEPVSGLN